MNTSNNDLDLDTTPDLDTAPRATASGRARDVAPKSGRELIPFAVDDMLVAGMEVPAETVAAYPGMSVEAIGDCLRMLMELFHNAGDGAREVGQPTAASMVRVEARRGRPIVVTNPGVFQLSHMLLVGKSSKRDSSLGLVGRWGQGFKLALVKAYQAAKKGGWPDIEIKVFSGDKVMEPRIVRGGAAHGHENIIEIEFRTTRVFRASTTVEVTGLPDCAWHAWTLRCLTMQKLRPEDATSVGESRILWKPEHRGLLFLRGVYVGPLDKSEDGGAVLAAAGYDIDGGVELDYDRRMADLSSARSKVVDLWRVGVDYGTVTIDAFLGMLSMPEGCFESDAFYNSYQWRSWGDSLATRCAADFTAQYGTNAVPVSSNLTMHEERLSAIGLRAVLVSRALCALIETKLGKIDTRRTARGTEVAETFDIGLLDAGERAVLDWMDHLVLAAGIDTPAGGYRVVRYVDPESRFAARCVEGGVEHFELARSLLASRALLLPVFVHELAHRKSDSHDRDHAREESRLFTLLVLSLTPEGAR